jgi:hypothetical protein
MTFSLPVLYFYAILPCLLPRCPRYSFPTCSPFGRYSTVPPFAFLLSLAHVLFELAERILSSLSADKHSPEGRGLERIRGASYALDVPAKQKPSPLVASNLL